MVDVGLGLDGSNQARPVYELSVLGGLGLGTLTTRTLKKEL